MYKNQKRGINCNRNVLSFNAIRQNDRKLTPVCFNYVTEEMLCGVCDDIVFDNTSLDDFPNTIVFFCKHAYHERCLLEKDSSSASDTASATMGSIADTINPGSLSSKINHSALLKSTRNIGCPICREQAAGGNAFVNRMKSQRRTKPGSIRSLGVVH